MGCDIHAVVQVEGPDGVWATVKDHWPQAKHHHSEALTTEFLNYVRSYRLFAILADVRNEWGFQAIAPDRGFPEDFPVELEYHPKAPANEEIEDPECVWMGDHSFTWVLLSELEPAKWPVEIRFFVDDWLPMLRELHPDPTKVRIVMGFDS